MSKHTPGPWSVNGLDQPHDKDRTVCFRTKAGNPFYVACVYGEGVLVSPSPERLANARLIAAAPDLLEACKAALEKICGNGQDGNYGEHQENPLPSKLRAAISKAGE